MKPRIIFPQLDVVYVDYSRGMSEFFERRTRFPFDSLHTTLITITCCFSLRERISTFRHAQGDAFANITPLYSDLIITFELTHGNIS